MKTSTSKQVSAILSVADERIRFGLVEEFIRSRYSFYVRVAHSLLPDAEMKRELGDIVQFIAIEEYTLLTQDVSESEALHEIQKWDNFIRVRARRYISRHFNSSEYHGIAGASGRTRRHVEISRVAAEMPEATGEEIVAETNARLSERLSDIDRQGMRCTLDDLRDIGHLYVDERQSPGAFESHSHKSDNPLLDSLDAERLTADILARARDISADHGVVAASWIGHGIGDVSTLTEIVDETGLDAYRVRSLLAEVRSEAIISASMVAGISVYQALGIQHSKILA